MIRYRIAANIFLISIIFASIAITSCQNINRTMMRKTYAITDSLYSFFPNNDLLFNELEYTDIVGTPKSFNKNSLCMFATTSLTEYYSCQDTVAKNKLIDHYRQTASAAFNSNDINYFIIGDEYELLKQFDSLSLKKAYEKIPVISSLLPHFNEFEPQINIQYDTSLCSLPNTYEIFVLKAGRISPSEDRKLYEWDLLPSRLKHGYNCGVAIDKSSPNIIYWALEW